MARTVIYCDLDAVIDKVVAACSGDMIGAVKALLLVNETLESELNSFATGRPTAHRPNVRQNVGCIEVCHSKPSLTCAIAARVLHHERLLELELASRIARRVRQLRQAYFFNCSGRTAASGTMSSVRRLHLLSRVLSDATNSEPVLWPCS